jgi:HAMP domain-containing protein
MAEVTAADFERMVEEGRAMLFALAQNDEIAQGIRPECDELLGRMLAASPRYTSLQVIDPEGYRGCGAVSLENPLYLGDRSYFLRATGNRAFAVGDYQVGRITGKANVGLAYPMYDEDDALRSVLATTLDLTALAAHGSAAELPPDATYTLSDLSGTVLVRFPEGEDWVGQPLPSDFPALRDSENVEPGVTEALDLDGVSRRFAVAPLVRPGGRPVGFLSVAVPRAQVGVGLDRVLRTELSILLIAAGFIILAAWSLGHFSILARVSAIMDAERRLASGDFTARTGIEYSDDELGRLAKTFDEMAAALEAREQNGAG